MVRSFFSVFVNKGHSILCGLTACAKYCPVEDRKPSFPSWPDQGAPLALDKDVGCSGILLWNSLSTPVSPHSERFEEDATVPLGPVTSVV